MTTPKQLYHRILAAMHHADLLWIDDEIKRLEAKRHSLKAKLRRHEYAEAMNPEFLAKIKRTKNEH